MNGTNLRFINTLILILFSILGITGLYSFFFTFPRFLFEIHRLAGWALIVLVPGKTAISLRSLRRGMSLHLDRSVMIAVSVLLSLATLTALALVLLWKWQIGPYYVWIGPFAYSAVGWHWGIAMGLAPLFMLHVWRRWPRPKRADFINRRQSLKLMGFGAAAIATWGMSEMIAKAAERSRSERRFTGSREDGSFKGLDYPVTSGADQGKIRLDPQTWTLTLHGNVKSPLRWNYPDILAFSTHEVTATIDCTGGWYSTQVWRGVWLRDLLSQAEIESEDYILLLKDVSGYTQYFTPGDVSEILLATHVGDQTLNHWHGFPLRAVVPARRGGHWVKWLTEMEIRQV